MRSFWIKRGEWLVGPVYARQYAEMIAQKWFRHDDELRVDGERHWQRAEAVVPPEAFEDSSGEVDSVPDAEDARDSKPVAQTETDWVPPHIANDRANPAETARNPYSHLADTREPQTDRRVNAGPIDASEPEGDSAEDVPPWFSKWRRLRQTVLSTDDDGAVGRLNSCSDGEQNPSEVDSKDSTANGRATVQLPEFSPDLDRAEDTQKSRPTGWSGPFEPVTDVPIRFATAEFEIPQLDAQPVSEADPPDQRRPLWLPGDPGISSSHPTLRVPLGADEPITFATADADLAEIDAAYCPAEPGALPNSKSAGMGNQEIESDVPRNPSDGQHPDPSKHLTWEEFFQRPRTRPQRLPKPAVEVPLVADEVFGEAIPAEPRAERRTKRAPPDVSAAPLPDDMQLAVDPFADCKHVDSPDEIRIELHEPEEVVPDIDLDQDVNPRKHEAKDEPAQKDLDFDTLARLAAHDPRVSSPAIPVRTEQGTVTSAADRKLLRTVSRGRFQTTMQTLFLVVGLQSCAMSAVTNGFVFLAFKRLFLLSMEVFIPFGQGTGESLEGPELAFAGIAMACAVALPFLPLSYLMRVDGRVMPYLISLGAAFFVAAVLHAGGLSGAAGAPLAWILFAAPAGVTVALCGLLAADSEDRQLRLILIGAAAASSAATAGFVIAAPDYGLVERIVEFPPEMHVAASHVYGVLLFYALQLTMIYMMLQRLAAKLFDESTIGFVQQHLVFHGILTITAFVLLIFVHAGAVTSWASAPTLLAGLTAIVALGFNLWSLTTHLIPRFDRLRVDP